MERDREREKRDVLVWLLFSLAVGMNARRVAPLSVLPIPRDQSDDI